MFSHTYYHLYFLEVKHVDINSSGISCYQRMILARQFISRALVTITELRLQGKGKLCVSVYVRVRLCRLEVRVCVCVCVCVRERETDRILEFLYSLVIDGASAVVHQGATEQHGQTKDPGIVLRVTLR